MRFLKLSLAALMVACSPAFAGFQAFNGTTNLGVVNKLKCSTGMTCTKGPLDQVTLTSSPAISGSPLSVTAASSTAALFDLIANNNAVNGDDWELQSKTSEGGLSFLNNTSGSLVQKMLLTTGGNLSVTGTFTPTGAIVPTGGIGTGTSLLTRFAAWFPSAVTDATSTTPVITDVYLTQVHVAHNFTITGIQVLNAATCGTNKWIVALFNSAGTVLANSATAGVLCSGASAFQSVPFTAPLALVGPETYWLGLYVNGTTDRFYAIPTAGAAVGLAGLLTGQTFGTVANITPPTTFTAGQGAVLATY